MIRKGKSSIACIIALILVGMLLFSGVGSAKQIISLASASMGGTYYIVAGAVADILSKNLPDLQVNAVIAQGSVGNPKLVDMKEAKLGISNYYSASDAIKGNKPYNKKLNIAAICPLQFSVLHFVTLGNDDLNTIQDLEGKEIAVGPAGGGGVMAFRRILPFWGLTIDDVVPSYLSYSDGSQALKDGNVQVTMPHGAPPLQAISQLAVEKDIEFIPIKKEKFDEITAKYPYYEHTTIPAGTYKGVDEEISALGINDILIVNRSMDEETVYKITKTIYNHVEELKAAHPSLSNLSFEGFNNSLVPLHPGAKKFYEEKGISIK